MSDRVAENVYLSDVEPHSAAPVDSVGDLRARVLLHVLFSDTLLIGDSQSLNNRYFRALVSDRQITGAGLGDTGAARPGDLAPLLRHGHIRVAVRGGATLGDIRDAHAARNVDNVPDPEYAAELQAMTDGRTLVYDGAAVAAAFKSGVLERIAAALTHARGEVWHSLRAAHDWAADQTPLDYKALRDWLARHRAEHPNARTDVVLALRSVDQWAGESYRQALPRALGAAVAAPLDDVDVIPAGRRHRLLDLPGLPPGLLDGLLLSLAPVDLLFEAMAQPSRGALLAQLARVRGGLQPDVGVLGAAAAEFSAWTTEAFRRVFRDEDGRAWRHLQGEDRLMRFGLDEDPTAGRLGAGMEMAHAAPDRTGALSLHVLSGAADPAPAAGDGTAVVPSPRRPQHDLDPRRRLVTL